MKFLRFVYRSLLVSSWLILPHLAADAADRVFMGVKYCSECHHNSMDRNQFNTWRTTKHAQAYAALTLPEAKEIARLSGIDEDPLESPICLGCHATAYGTEEWQRDPAFHFEDGVQCERCHGAGSDFSVMETMQDHAMAMKAGLSFMSERDCLVCHKDKPSHTSVIKVKPFVYGEALMAIGHKGRGKQPPVTKEPAPEVKPLEGPKYIGSLACAKCHNSPNEACSFGSWRMSPHARAYAVLSSKKGLDAAHGQGIQGDPQQSEQCLKCHTTGFGEPAGRLRPDFDPMDGIQCESCHGPGSEYATEEIMRDKNAARAAGLKDITRETCLTCHAPDRFKDEWLAAMTQKARTPIEIKTQPVYKTPFNLTVSQNGKRLFVACEASDSLIVLEAASGAILQEIAVENQPHDVCLTPDEKWILVSNRASDTVSVIDAETYHVIGTIAVGDEPHGLAVTRDGSTLYVANGSSYDISVVDLAQRKETKRLSAGRGTWDAVLSPDGKQIFVSNNLSHFAKFREPSLSEVTAIDTTRSTIRHRFMIPETNLVQGVAFSPDGEFALATMLRTKNLVPMTRVMQGWVITNGLAVLWKNGKVDQLLLDEPDDFFADPTDIVIGPDGKYAFVTGAGINAVSVIDLAKMKALLQGADENERKNVFPNHLGLSLEYVIKRIPVGRSPRGMALSPDGRYLYVTDGLDDAVSVIDTESLERVKVFDLGGPKEITLERYGERIFNDARVAYGHQFSCHTCHPDGHVDGITYDIEADGLGLNPVDNRTLRGIVDTGPFKWSGKNPTLSRQCGARLAVFFTRFEPFTPEQIKAVDRYITTIVRPPNRHNQLELTPPQQRGRVLFERDRDNLKREIPVENRCTTCHPAPYYTNRQLANIGSATKLDTAMLFDVPHLNNIYDSAPYMHDGKANSLEEIWTRYNPYDTHGVTNDMTKDQLNDLIEYIKTF